MKEVFKYAVVIGPLLTIIGTVAAWIYHVEIGLRAATDVNNVREQITGLNKDLGHQRGRIANLEQLFEPYLIEKRVQEELKKRSTSVPVSVPSVPKAVKKEAENWARSQINRGTDDVEPPK